MSTRRDFLKSVGTGFPALSMTGIDLRFPARRHVSRKPNILFCMADDWSWPHAGIYGDPVVQTPTFDRLAREGMLGENAFVSSPSCTPSRNAVLTGQYHWRLGEGANLWSTLDVNIAVYPLLLEKEGYHVGRWRKCWGPGDLEAGGYTDSNPGGTNFPNGFREFLNARPEGAPFCFWLGSSDPHRPYEKGSGVASGIDISEILVPGYLPDVYEIRSDIADYYFEVQRFDRDCGEAIRLLEEIGELDDTIIVMTGDNGMPFPRCKSNIYEQGVHAPLAIRWGTQIAGGRRVKAFISLVDLAPTFLEAAGVAIPQQMTGRSLFDLFQSREEDRINPEREHVIIGKERHTPAQRAPSIDGYPCRGIRTDRYLYIRNFFPERWPAGVPDGASHPMRQFSDCDNSPTKSFLLENKDKSGYRGYYELCFDRRPAEELYDLSQDPDQLHNIADKPEYISIREGLSTRLISRLKATEDPRVIGGGEKFDQYPYRSGYELHRKPS